MDEKMTHNGELSEKELDVVAGGADDSDVSSVVEDVFSDAAESIDSFSTAPEEPPVDDAIEEEPIPEGPPAEEPPAPEDGNIDDAIDEALPPPEEPPSPDIGLPIQAPEDEDSDLDLPIQLP